MKQPFDVNLALQGITLLLRNGSHAIITNKYIGDAEYPLQGYVYSGKSIELPTGWDMNGKHQNTELDIVGIHIPEVKWEHINEDIVAISTLWVGLKVQWILTDKNGDVERLTIDVFPEGTLPDVPAGVVIKRPKK